MRCVLAIDPGTTESAFVKMRGDQILAHGKVTNEEMRRQILAGDHDDAEHLAIEMIASYGMPVGEEVFETCTWIGRFEEVWGEHRSRVLRRDVKLHVCGSPRAKDANIRQALLDRFGPPGTKKQPGATYGMKADVWQALAVAVTWSDRSAVL